MNFEILWKNRNQLDIYMYKFSINYSFLAPSVVGLLPMFFSPAALPPGQNT